MMRHRRQRRFRDLALVLIMIAGPAEAARAATVLVDIRAGSLQDALAELGRETGIEVLYAADVVRGRRAPAVKGRLTPERAIALLTGGSGVGYRITPDGVFVLFELPKSELADPGDGAVSELLVVGRRTQNADIRRTQNDIQPYTVIGARLLDVAPHDNLDQLLRERLPANGQVISPVQNVNAPVGANSAINLRGIGQQRTLVLVDGRRLPSLPSDTAGFEQSDINAIPMGAVERIEVLTATAGGIHGPTAIGGVVNVVLKRDYRGADLTVESGLSSRGDAGRGRVEARIGFTPDHGRTDVMLAASYSAAQRLTVGRRDYARRSLEWQAANGAPAFLLQQRPVNAITVRTSQGDPLRLDPAYGGSVLAGSYSFLPIGFQGSDQEKAAVLAANAGKLPADPAAGMAGDDTSLVSTPQTRSLLFSVRRRFSDHVEAFADGFSLHDRSWNYATRHPGFRSETQANAAGNLFANAVYFYFPVPGLVDKKITTTDVSRATGGLIASLPRRWQASADYTLGRSILERRRDGRTIYGIESALWNGLAGPAGQPPVIPLGDYASLQAAAMAYAVPSGERTRLTTDFSSGVIRAAGPIITLPGGPLTATLLTEVRRERMPRVNYVAFGVGGRSTYATNDRTQRVASAYAEFRAPVMAGDARFVPARGLELQLALRRDQVETTFPDTVLTSAATTQTMATVRNIADVYTVGARSFPTDWLMIRASAATGKTPPDITQLQELAIVPTSFGAYPFTDPKRGGRPVIADGPFAVAQRGWHGIGQETGLTRSIGVVINPSGRNGPRVSIDASRVEAKGEINPIGIGGQDLINAEALYPGRVVREPLSAADAALGYTAGRIVAINGVLGNVGRTIAETVDVNLDWALPRVLQGETLLYGAGTWQPTLKTQRRPGTPWLDRVGYREDPLRWRGNAGVQWARGLLSLDLNAQYLCRSSPRFSAYSKVVAQNAAYNQTRTYTPSRLYLDLTARRRFDIPAGHGLESLNVRFAVQNLLDSSPPIVADPNNMGYDYRGDPRRRRFELSVSGRF